MEHRSSRLVVVASLGARKGYQSMQPHAQALTVRLLFCATLAAVLLTGYVGCSSGASVLSGEGFGTVRFAIHWPGAEATSAEAATASPSDEGVSVRAIPTGTRSIVVTVTGSSIATPITESVIRPEGPAPVTEVMLRVPPGSDRTVRVEACGIGGSVLASRQLVVDVMAGATTSVDVALSLLPSPMVFHSDRSGTTQLYVMDLWGNVAQLTDAVGRSMYPGWSPDGTRVAFTSDRDSGETYFQEIYACNADGTGVVRLTNTSADEEQPCWSPDGARIAYSRFEKVGEIWGEREIWLMDSDGSDQVQLTDLHARAEGPSWSPDGTTILFCCYPTSGTPFDIYSVKTDGTGLTRITSNALEDRDPVWSPDGARIAFTHKEGEADSTREVYVMDADGTDITQLTNNGAEDARPAWSYDGQRIVFCSHRTGDYEVFVMAADGSDPVNLTNSPGTADLYPNLAPNPY